MATVSELKVEAKELGIKGFSKMKKADLESAIAVKKAADSPYLPDTMQAQLDTAARVNPLLEVRTPEEHRKARNKAKARRRNLRAHGFQAGPCGRVNPRRSRLGL